MIGLEARGRARLETVVAEAMQTSAIEGEVLNPAAVRSSAARRLGLDTAGFSPLDRICRWGGGDGLGRDAEHGRAFDRGEVAWLACGAFSNRIQRDFENQSGRLAR